VAHAPQRCRDKAESVVPAAMYEYKYRHCHPPPQPNINTTPPGSITFRIYFNPVTVGCFVMHCHVLTHEDLGMMQWLDLLPGPNQPSGCMLDAMPHSKALTNARRASARTGIMSPAGGGALERRTAQVTQE
jgi:hypothetical protein